MGQEQSDSRAKADAKGKSRMRKYEAGQQEKVSVKDDEKSFTYWEKIEPGEWEEKEYVIKIVK